MKNIPTYLNIDIHKNIVCGVFGMAIKTLLGISASHYQSARVQVLAPLPILASCPGRQLAGVLGYRLGLAQTQLFGI